MLSARTYRQIGSIVGELAESGLAKGTDDMPMPRSGWPTDYDGQQDPKQLGSLVRFGRKLKGPKKNAAICGVSIFSGDTHPMHAQCSGGTQCGPPDARSQVWMLELAIVPGDLSLAGSINPIRNGWPSRPSP